MAIPGSSDGQEVLRRGVIQTQSSDDTSFKWDGTSPTTTAHADVVPTNHIITLLSIIFCETGNAAELMYLQHVQGYILHQQDIAARGTFIWNERLTLQSGEILKTWMDGSADVDIHYSYLDQDWS